MAQHEYKILHGPPGGIALMPWASQALRDQVGRGSFERKLNALAAEGWEVISCSTASRGNFFWISPQATVVLRRDKPPG
jgi:hypothetical protein